MADTETIVQLFIKSKPIIYFYKDEPYLPCDFDNLLNIANVKKEDLPTTNLINIPKNKRFDHPVSTQILCKTEGFITVNNRTYIDLVYVVTFSWNGTLEEHAFDKEEIIIRLEKNDNKFNIIRIFGSAHGNGMWWSSKLVDIENEHYVLYSANESHAIYNEPRVHKRIFGFGNDECGADIRWEPTEFVIFNIDNTIKIYNDKFVLLNNDASYFGYNREIGNEKNSQTWPGGLTYETLDLDGYYKYQGGFDNLFSGRSKVINTKIRYGLRTICGIIFTLFLGYFIYNNVIKTSYATHETIKKLGMLTLQLFIFVSFFIASAYISWEIFIISPISNYDINTTPIQLYLYDENNNDNNTSS
jgi:hypothetical protein